MPDTVDTGDPSAPTGPPPVVLVHGWGGSFDTTWARSGFADLLQDAGRTVIGVDLLGHGDAPKPHDPEAYRDLTERIYAEIGPSPVDAVGFSLGALTLLRAASQKPDRFNRLVLAGIGQNVFERDDAMRQRIVRAIEGEGDPDDNLARLFSQYAHQPGNDPEALAAIMRRNPPEEFTERSLAAITHPTLIAVGEHDFVMPADHLVASLPNASLAVLRRTDHFATPESFAFIDAALEFLDAIAQ